jgi:hypothetical protein
MVSFEVQQARKYLAGVLVLTAVAAPCAGLAQPTQPRAEDERRQAIVAQIYEEQSQNGPYSADLLDPLTALSLLYQESGDHALAVAAIERALGIVRANYGLRSIDQAPLLRQKIHNEEARGNYATAWELEQSLVALLKDHPHELETVPILREIGDKRMELLRRYRSGELPPQIYLGCYYEVPQNRDDRNCYAGSRGFVINSIAAEAWRYYAEAIGVLLRHELYSSAELRDLEMELIRSSYEHDNYGLGLRSLRRLLAYDFVNSAPWLTRIESAVLVGDWELLFGQHGLALEIYEQAYEQLEQRGAPQTAADEMFLPKVPVMLPTFLPNPLATDATETSTGYIDVAFEVTKYGRSRNVEILTMTNASDVDKDRLVQLISRSRFRPLVSDGQFTRTSPIVVRYHLNER